MKEVRIVGVPEHFNMPWHMAIEEGAFEERGIQLSWTDIPEGTGRMSQMLQANSTDLAIILTEGITKSIADGNPSVIVQEYISSPLQWGIHVSANANISTIAQLEGLKAAISRYGSGSHLMTYLMAQKYGWDPALLQFVTVNNLPGAVESIQNGESDYFLWEHFTTKPIVDQGIFKRLGDFPTPWPCFVIAANKRFLENNRNTMAHILEVINGFTSEFKRIPSIDRSLANRYEQDLEDIQKWLQITDWSQNQISIKTIDFVVDTLYNLKLIDNIIKSDLLLAS